MGPAKTREWTEEETKLLIELAQRKERVPAMARELGRHIASVRRRALELGLPLPQGRGERTLAFSRAVETLPGGSFVNGAVQTHDAALVAASAEMKRLTGLVGNVRWAIG